VVYCGGGFIGRKWLLIGLVSVCPVVHILIVAHQRGSTDAISSDTFVCYTLLVTIKHILADVVTISWNDVLADEQSTWGKKLEKENELSCCTVINFFSRNL